MTLLGSSEDHDKDENESDSIKYKESKDEKIQKKNKHLHALQTLSQMLPSSLNGFSSGPTLS
eukprot:6883789-Ditylum_brightwellii.AAC.1